MGASLNKILARIIKQQTTTAGVGGDFLPLNIATRFIDFVRDANYCRGVFRIQPMSSKTLDIPKILSAGQVYYENTETTAAVRTNFTTGAIRLIAKKFLSNIDISAECLEDAAFDMDAIIRDQCAQNMGQAEEEAMMVGNPSHAATATQANATAANWYSKDHRLIFSGLFTIGGTVNAATPVSAHGAVASSSHLREMMYNLGKYGRVMSELVTFVNPYSMNQLLDDSKLVTIDKAGAKATIFTGAIALLYGKINCFNEVYAPDGQACMTPKNNPIIGDRRAIKVENERVILQDMTRYVVSERIDFKTEHEDAVVLCEDLETPEEES